ncbi:MFS general substrate transporter [Penicillium lividum]|nr:MFS general substrate transporter [Penicillium lividum]
MLLPNGLALLGAAYPPGKKKHMVFALFGAMAPNGALLEAVFAAIISQLGWWPWTFRSMAMYSFLLAILGVFVIPTVNYPVRGMEIAQIIKELDLLGAALGICGLVLINLAWNQAPVVGWDQPYVYIVLIIGFLFLVALLIVEIKVSSNPLIPFHALNMNILFFLAGLTFVSLLVMPWGMDMSFPAATIILSDAVGSRLQGAAAFFVTTIVNYSISLGLGFAGTVEVHVNNGG